MSANKKQSLLLDYFGRIEIIHLKSRVDRYSLLVKELNRIGLEIDNQKVCIPDAPILEDANGFPSRSVYGNFLSHLDILRRARDELQQPILVLEDDAIFRTFVGDSAFQKQLVDSLTNTSWDICYLGHPVTHKLKDQPTGLIPTSLGFKWAHCYSVHPRTIGKLVQYMEETIERPKGDPKGGKMYIDAALTLFRRFNPEIVTLISNPALSIQRGSPSGIAERKWYDKVSLFSQLLASVRGTRDEIWRRTGLFR